MKIPKLHSDKLNDIVNEISSIDDSVVKMFKRLNDAVNERAKKALERIDGIISDIKEILKTNECSKMDLELGSRRFILGNTIRDVYITITGIEDGDVILSWPPGDSTKLDGAKKLKPIACKNDALENMCKIQYLEDHAKLGEEIMHDFISSYAAHVGYQQRQLATFIEKADLDLED